MLEVIKSLILLEEEEEMALILLDEEEEATFNRRISQLIVLLASTPSLQVTLILTIIQMIKQIRDKRRYSKQEVQLLGRVYGEILIRSEMFPPMKLSSIDVKNSTVDGVLAEIIPIENFSFYVYSASLLHHALIWVSYYNKAESDEMTNTSRIFRRLQTLYFCVSSRALTSVSTNMILPEEGVDWISVSIGQLPPVIGKRTYNCCRYLVENISFFIRKISLDDWITFEMETPWKDASISDRLNHSFHWFNTLSSTKDINEKFLLLFWKLLDVGLNKENSSEMLILLQRLAFESFDSSSSFSLLQEWKKWKSEGRIKAVESSSNGAKDYHAKFMAFISLCSALPVTILIGKSINITTLSIFQHLIVDILDATSTVFLQVRDTLLLLECFLKVAKYCNPPEGLMKESFSLLKESVLFHLGDVLPLLLKYSDFIEKHPCMRPLLQISLDRVSSFKILPEKEVSIIIASIAYNEMNLPSLTLSSIPFLAAFLGCNLLIFEEYSDDPGAENKILPQSLKKVVEAGINIISSEEQTPDTTHILSVWKRFSIAPVFYRALLLGINFLIRKLMNGNTKLSIRHTTWLYSLLLCSFNDLTHLFEEKEGKETPSLGYLSYIFTQIHLITKNVPLASLKHIPEIILSKVDSEIKTLIRHRIVNEPL